MTTQDSLTILYISNSLQDRQQFENLLSHYKGVNILLKKSAEEGIPLAEEDPPSAILIDIDLPKMNGYSAAKVLRRKAEFKHMYLVALMKEVSTDSKHKAIDVGFNEVIEKPMESNHIIQVINKISGRKPRNSN